MNDTPQRGVDLSVFDDPSEEDELVEEAKQRAAAAGGVVPEDWGALVTLEPAESFTGRWRGETIDEENDKRAVYLLWRSDGTLGWMRTYTALAREIGKAKPEVGDRVVIHRGDDYQSKHGTAGFSFGVATAPCSDPLPTSDDHDVPF